MEKNITHKIIVKISGIGFLKFGQNFWRKKEFFDCNKKKILSNENATRACQKFPKLIFKQYFLYVKSVFDSQILLRLF